MNITFNPKGKRGQRYPCEMDDGSTIYLPSVTEILGVIGKGEALINWAANQERAAVTEAATGLYDDVRGMPKLPSGATYTAALEARISKVKAWRRELEKAAEIGTGAHHLVEHFSRQMMGQKVGPEPAVPEKSLWAAMAWQDWAKSVDYEPLMLEQQVWSVTHLYAGTLDWIGNVTVNGKRYRALGDLKSSKAIYPEYHIQVAAYEMALREMGHEPTELRMIVRLPKKESDPDFEVRIIEDDVNELFSVFLNALAIYRWKNRS